MDNFDPYNVFLAIATNIPVLLMTDFVLRVTYVAGCERQTFPLEEAFLWIMDWKQG